MSDDSFNGLKQATWLRESLGLAVGETPFPWQVRLLSLFARGTAPAALDIPTGLGKTAVMAVWLVARASTAPVSRRLVYVVDRRAVVDQATSEAERLRAWVDRRPEVRSALGLEGQLPISTLRGQHVDNRRWLEAPSSPAIVVGTVDMIGSRLLFQGYGVGRGMRPYHAGLLGVDSLIVLDEAHLAQPFERLLEQIGKGVDAQGRGLGPGPELKQLVPGFRTLSLSATGRNRSADEVLRLDDEDRRHPVVWKRLSASKRLVMRSPVDAKDLPATLADEAWALANDGKRPTRIIVFCTSREHAQSVQAALAKRASKSQPIDSELFVGERRVYEREEASRWLATRGFLAGSPGRPERAAFVIATAAGEVGVDLDADHAVCDLVAWERMVQRFGRVNRRGDRDATIIVVPTTRDDRNDAAMVRSTRQEASHEVICRLRVSAGQPDASPDGLIELRSRAESDPALAALIANASTPAPLHPPLTRALVEAWSMTSLDDHTGRPEVTPWIRGWPDEEEEPRTTVVWRRDLPVTDDAHLLGRQDMESFHDSADPHLAERLETDTRRVVEWLAARLEARRTSNTADSESQPWPSRSNEAIAVVFGTRDGGDRLIRAEHLVKGDRRDETERSLRGATVLVDIRLGGLAQSGLLDDDCNDVALDVTEVDGAAGALAPASQARPVPFRIRRVTAEDGDEAGAEGWRVEASIVVRKSEEGDADRLLIESLIQQAAESEEGRSAARRNQLLAEHQEWTEVFARGIAARIGLDPAYAEMISVSSRLHDEGKQAPAWQRAFRAPSDDYYAKTRHRPNQKLLGGYRHEFGSLPFAERHERVGALTADLRDLCLHLIAAHHGNARPTIRTDGASEPPSRLVARAREVALRFVALERRWGPWGLAWWEALLRSADQQASRRNDQDGAIDG